MTKMCEDHWERLQGAIDDRGLGNLVVESGEEVATKMRRQQEEGLSIDNFAPLMQAHLHILQRSVEIAGPNIVGIPGCCICAMSNAHKESCDGCDLPRENGFDFLVDEAADTILGVWQDLGVT